MGQVVALPITFRHRRDQISPDVINSMRIGEKIYDTNIGGFYVIRGKSNKVTFRVLADMPRKTLRFGKSYTLDRTVGHWPEMKVQAARREALFLIGQIKKGIDPKSPERSGDSPTLREAWTDYRDDYLVKKDRRPSTVVYYGCCYQRIEHWADMKLADIATNPLALKAEHARIARTHGRNGQPAKSAADSTLKFVAIIYERARGTWINLPEWPRRAVVTYGRRSNAYRGMGPAHLSTWWEEVQQLQNPVRRELLLFTLLSGLRSKDARSVLWENVDRTRMSLLVPEPKGGPKRAFRLPITTAMLECLERAGIAWETSGRSKSNWAFPSALSASGRIETIRCSYADDRGELRFVKTGHDLRHSFVNIAREAGVPKPAVSMLLNHKARDVTEGYHDPDATPLYYAREMQKISDLILAEIDCKGRMG